MPFVAPPPIRAAHWEAIDGNPFVLTARIGPDGHVYHSTGPLVGVAREEEYGYLVVRLSGEWDYCMPFASSRVFVSANAPHNDPGMAELLDPTPPYTDFVFEPMGPMEATDIISILILRP